MIVLKPHDTAKMPEKIRWLVFQMGLTVDYVDELGGGSECLANSARSWSADRRPAYSKSLKQLTHTSTATCDSKHR